MQAEDVKTSPDALLQYYQPNTDPRRFDMKSKDEAISLLANSIHPSHMAFVKGINSGYPLHVFNPSVYIEAYKSWNGTPQLSDMILKQILAQVQTRRLITTPLWDGKRINKFELPACHIKTIVLKCPTAEDRVNLTKFTTELMELLYIETFEKQQATDYENEADEIRDIKAFKQGTMDANIARQLRVVAVHLNLYSMIATDQTADRMKELGHSIMESMDAAQTVHDLPNSTISIRKLRKEEISKKEKKEKKDEEQTYEQNEDEQNEDEDENNVPPEKAQTRRQLASRSGGTVQDVLAIRDSDKFGGLMYYYLANSREPDLSFPSTEALNILQYFVKHSPKYTYVLTYLYEHCRLPQYKEMERAKAAKVKPNPDIMGSKKRVALFFANPLTQA